ncbi:hypothetical protein RYX36_014749 [Vicia faba]
MGNSFGCSASGERLVSAARDGDLVEAKMLLEFNPGLAKYSTFGCLNSPLHFAASNNEIVALFLEKGADVNSRNYCGQTALMQACRHGHWEVVQTLMLYRCNVMKADYLSGRTALHFAAVSGHVRCIRLVVADFVPSAPYETLHASADADVSDGSNTKRKNEQSTLSKFVNKTADAGITALHMAALNDYFDCVQLLLDLNVNMSAATYHYGTPMNVINDYGADALRLYLINSPVVHVEPLRFKKEVVYGVVRNVFLPWYSFFPDSVWWSKGLFRTSFTMFGIE